MFDSDSSKFSLWSLPDGTIPLVCDPVLEASDSSHWLDGVLRLLSPLLLVRSLDEDDVCPDVELLVPVAESLEEFEVAELVDTDFAEVGAVDFFESMFVESELDRVEAVLEELELNEVVRGGSLYMLTLLLPLLFGDISALTLSDRLSTLEPD